MSGTLGQGGDVIWTTVIMLVAVVRIAVLLWARLSYEQEGNNKTSVVSIQPNAWRRSRA